MTRPLTIAVLLTLAVVLLRLRVVGWGRREGQERVPEGAPYPPEGDDGLLPADPWPDGWWEHFAATRWQETWTAPSGLARCEAVGGRIGNTVLRCFGDVEHIGGHVF